MRIYVTQLCIAMLFLCGCYITRIPTFHKMNSSLFTNADTLIALTNYDCCMGSVSRQIMFSDGKVVRNWNQTYGSMTDTIRWGVIPRSSFDLLLSTFLFYDFQNLDSVYSYGNNCPNLMTDVGRVEIVLKTGRNEKRVTLNDGCHGTIETLKISLLITAFWRVLSLEKRETR